MSYSSIGNYGDYYESNHGQQKTNNSYSNNRRSSSNNSYPPQASYPGDIGQTSYGSSGYNWSNQSQPQQQQNYPGGSRQPPAYNHDGWGDASARNAAHEERTQGNNYATSAAAGQGQNYHVSAPTTQSSQGLTSLAYASGSEDAGLQQHSQQSQRSKAPTAPSYSSVAPSHSLNHVQSPVTNSSASRYSSVPSTSNYAYQNESTSSQSQSSSLSAAAAALAGAVSARFSQASAAMGHQSSTSPVMTSSASASVQQSASQRSVSPYQYPQSVKSQSQKRQTSSTPQTTQKAANATAYQVRAPTTQISDHLRNASQNTAERASRTHNQPVNSISNLVTPPTEEPAPNQHSNPDEAHSMPNFIDPTQVFNPYAREHERRRKEAAAEAEAEVRRKKAADEAARAEAERIKKREAEEAAAAKLKADEEAALSARKLKKASPHAPNRKAVRDAPPPKSQPSAITSQADQTPKQTASETPDMATELKMMMEKMKEFHNKDPSLFQKLWEDMRKPTTQSSSSVTLPPVLPQPSAQPSDSPQPQASILPAIASPVVSQNRQATPNPASLPRPRKKADQSELPIGGKFNGYKVVVENNPEYLPDLGRFPAERRIRKSLPKKPTEPATAPESPKQSLPADVPLNTTASKVSEATLKPPRSSTGAQQPAQKVVTLTQGLPQRGPTGCTIWPEDKRNALALAAVTSLKKIPENAAVEITPDDIHEMLERNPSYIELCELLEKRGLKFHRGHFARQLLSNVPYLNGPTGKQAPTPTPPTVQILPPITVPPSGDPMSSHGHNGTSSVPIQALDVRFQPINGALVTSEKGGPVPQYPPSIQMPRQRTGRPHPLSRPEPPPGSKEALARKRDFSELVDLTALSDNEDYVMSRKQARVESPSPEPIDPFQHFHNQAQQSQRVDHNFLMYAPSVQNKASEIPLRFDPSQPPVPHGHPPPPHHPSQTQPRSQGTASATTHQTPSKIMAKPVNKHEALRKTYYDAKTVARDVLIAAGRHPSERPLNAHLAGLLGKHIDMESDLSTFDWDAVDPGGPPMPQVAYADVPMEPPRFAFGQAGARRPKQHQVEGAAASASEVDPARLPVVDKRLTPAPALPLAPTRTQEPPSRQKAQSPSSPLRVGTDIVSPLVVQRPRPGRPRKTEPAPRPTSTLLEFPLRRHKAGLLRSQSALTAPDSARSARSSSTRRSPGAPPVVGAPNSSVKTMDAPRVSAGGKRIGRPPGSKNLHPRKVAPQIPTPQPQISIPPKAVSHTNPIFKCRWKGCHAYIHNLETLRNHVSNVHPPTSQQLIEQDGYVCWWKRCHILVEDEDGRLGPSHVFENKQDWVAHIEDAHLREIARKQGSGPSLTHIDPQTILQDRARYLAHPQGQITTPDVSAASTQDVLEPDTMRLLPAEHHNYEEHAQRAFMKTHRQEKSSPKAVAEETLKAMSARKAKIGAGIDRGGCILVTEERRATFVHNPAIQRVVDGDY